MRNVDDDDEDKVTTRTARAKLAVKNLDLKLCLSKLLGIQG